MLQTTTYKETPNFFGVDYTKKGIATKVRINYTTFGSILPGRSFSSNAYKYGFNGMLKDDEITGNSGTHYSAEFWEYDSRLGRRWNTDPMSYKYPSQSPYACFNNNPILLSDPDGLEATKKNPETKFNRKFERWQRKHEDELAGKSSWEKFEDFKHSKNIFGKEVIETKWFHEYSKNSTRTNSRSTWFPVVGSLPSNEIKSSNSSGVDNVTQTVDVPQSGQIKVIYNMYEKPDRMQVINTVTGDVMFDTKSLPVSDGDGAVMFKRGSGRIINYNLGAGNTKITILVNPGVTPVPGEPSKFEYNLLLNPNAILLQGIKYGNIK